MAIRLTWLARVQKLDIADASAIDSGLVRDQADIATAKKAEIFFFKDVNTRQNHTLLADCRSRFRRFPGTRHCGKDTPGQYRANTERQQIRVEHTDYKRHDRLP